MEEDWFLYSLTLFTFLVIFGLCYIRHVYTFFERNKIPKVSNPTFPFGNIYDVIFQNSAMFMHLWKYYSKFKKKNCKYGGFYMFLKPAVVITDPQLIQIVLKNDNFQHKHLHSNKRKCADFGGEFENQMLKHIFKTYQKSWSDVIDNVTDEEVNLNKLMEQHFDSYGLKEISKSIFDCILNKTGCDLKKKISITLPYQLSNSCVIKDNDIEFCAKLLEDILKNRKKNDILENDVLHIFNVNNFTINQMVIFLYRLVDNLRISNNSVLFALYELSCNQEIQDDLRGEILRFKKNKNINSAEELKELSYLQTVIRETLRKYPPEPYISKICEMDYKENDINFPKDLVLFIPIFGIHHDCQIYVNPEQFDPDRFSEENEKFVDPIKYFPFGNKKQNHFDFRFVNLIMELTLIEVIARFKISLGKKWTKFKFDETSFELKVKNEIWLKFEKL